MSDRGEEINPSATITPEVHQALEGVISKSFSHLSSNLSSVIESRLSEFKRELADVQCSSVDSAVKRVKRNEVEFKHKGNRKQFEHQEQVLESLVDAKESLEKAKYDRPKRVIEQGISLAEKRIKVIKLADRSEFGWNTVNEYLSDELVSNSEDETRIFRSERRAERRLKQSLSRRKNRSSSSLSRQAPKSPSYQENLAGTQPFSQSKGQDWTLL